MIGSDVFGIPDIVQDGRNRIYHAARRIVETPDLLTRLTEGARATPIRIPEAEFEARLDLYRRASARPA